VEGDGLNVVGVGALNYDRLYLVPRVAAPGEEIWVNSRFTGGGGSAANSIVGLARLGVKTGFIGTVGKDPEGDILLEELEKEGVDTGGITRIEGNTGEIVGLVDSEGERVLYAYPGVNDSLVINDSQVKYAKKAEFLHLSSFVGELSYRSQKGLLDRLESRVTFSPGMLYAKKGMKVLEGVIRRSSVIFLNKDELALLTGKEFEGGVRKLLEAGAKTVVVTLGMKGCYVSSRESRKKIHGYPVKAVDTTGAGDAFVAGFIYGMLMNLEMEICGRVGNKLASLCVGAVGARTGLPRKDDIQDFISSLK
jgi:ribokinase